jgi:protein tyrosine phosphatase
MIMSWFFVFLLNSFAFLSSVQCENFQTFNEKRLKSLFRKIESEKPLIETLDTLKKKLKNGRISGEYQKIHDVNASMHHSAVNIEKDLIGLPCFDHSRVVLPREFPNSSDYINANYVEGYREARKFILTTCKKLSIAPS